MKAGQRTVIEVELEQSLSVRRRRAAVNGWCPVCAAEVAMLTPDEAASLISITTRALYRLIEADSLHFVETSLGLIRLCLPSLLASASKEE